MPIMPLKESLCENVASKVDEIGSERKRKRGDSGDRRSTSKSSPHHRRSHKSSRTSRSGRSSRNFRGSSGTRTSQRSADRSIRLKQYYENQKQSQRGDQDHGSKERGTRKEDSNHNCSSTKSSQSKNTTPNSHKSHHHSSTNGSSSSNNNNHTETRVLNDEEGHLIYRSGDWLQNRYKINGLLGQGTFGRCLDCYDKKYDQNIALKVVKNISKYREAARLEVQVLKRLLRKDPNTKYFNIKLLGAFNYHGHICLVFPKLGKSVFDFMKENLFHPYPISQVQHIAQQLITSVNFLHTLSLTHTDLKPENMLFEDSAYSTYWSNKARQDVRVLKRSDIQVIDFGSATFDDEHHSSIVSTRHYRAPEVVLKLGWSQPCDVWSCGCIIFELYTGNTLFLTHDNREHLAMMEYTLGTIPKHMIRKSRLTRCFVDDKVDYDDGRYGGYVMSNCKPLKEHMNSDDTFVRELYDLLKCLLEFDPKERVTASEALKHPFFKRSSSPRSSRRR